MDKDDFTYTYKETLMAQVVNKKDEVTLKAIQDYITKRKLEFDENITAILIDEDKLNLILKLGIAEYERRKIEDRNGDE
jgi:hypothetical protein